jgi:hypothetical protein
VDPLVAAVAQSVTLLNGRSTTYPGRRYVSDHASSWDASELFSQHQHMTSKFSGQNDPTNNARAEGFCCNIREECPNSSRYVSPRVLFLLDTNHGVIPSTGEFAPQVSLSGLELDM